MAIHEDDWQYKAARIQFRPETDIQVGRFEGRVEQFHHSGARDFSLEELWLIANILTEVSHAEQL